MAGLVDSDRVLASVAPVERHSGEEWQAKTRRHVDGDSRGAKSMYYMKGKPKRNEHICAMIGELVNIFKFNLTVRPPRFVLIR